MCPFDGAPAVAAGGNRNATDEPSKPQALQNSRFQADKKLQVRDRIKMTIYVIGVLIVVGGLLAFLINLVIISKPAPQSVSAEMTASEFVKLDDLAGAITVLEQSKKTKGTLTPKEDEMLSKLYVQRAQVLKGEKQTAEALTLLKKVPAKSASYAQASQLIKEWSGRRSRSR